ncbi:sugar transferase [Helicobacter pullorum]|nr:sugar transferase [Helicobacter pullorum]
MRNANSAIERVRNQLSYKLGQAMIASSKAPLYSPF